MPFLALLLFFLISALFLIAKPPWIFSSAYPKEGWGSKNTTNITVKL